MKSCKNLKGGLQEVADDLQVTRIGPQHQAGSDSLLTLLTFFKMLQTFFEGQIDDDKFMGFLYGLGQPAANQKIVGNNNNSLLLDGTASSSDDQRTVISTATANDAATNAIAQMSNRWNLTLNVVGIKCP